MDSKNFRAVEGMYAPIYAEWIQAFYRNDRTAMRRHQAQMNAIENTLRNLGIRYTFDDDGFLKIKEDSQ